MDTLDYNTSKFILLEMFFESKKYNEQVRKKWAIEKRALLMQNKHQEG